MTIGWGQILLIFIVGFLLFGNFPKKVEEIARGLRLARKEWEKKDKDEEEGEGSVKKK